MVADPGQVPGINLIVSLEIQFVHEAIIAKLAIPNLSQAGHIGRVDIIIAVEICPESRRCQIFLKFLGQYIRLASTGSVPIAFRM